MATGTYNPNSWANQWANNQNAQPLDVRSTSRYAGGTGATGLTGANHGAPTWTGNPGAWSTDKNGAPMSMFGATIGGGQLQDVYGTNPVRPGGTYPTGGDEIARPTQPSYNGPPVTTQPVGPTQPGYNGPPVTTQPVGPGGQALPAYNLPQWNPNVPTYNPTPATSIGNPTWGAMFPAGYQNTPEWWADPTNQAAMANALPALLYDWNRYQYANDFNEANMRDTRNFDWQSQLDRYNMDLAGRQQQQSEAQDALAAQQWGEQYKFQTGQAAIENDLAYKAQAIDQAYKNNLITNDQRRIAIESLQQQATASYQQGLLSNDRARMENDLTAARYAAFGRAQAPGGGRTSWYRNW